MDQIAVADSIIKALIFDVAVQAVEAEALTLAPWLGLPVIHTVEHFILEQVADKIYEKLSLTVNFEIIDVQVQSQKKAYDEALAKLNQSHSQGDTDALEKAKAELKHRLADLIHVRK